MADRGSVESLDGGFVKSSEEFSHIFELIHLITFLNFTGWTLLLKSLKVEILVKDWHFHVEFWCLHLWLWDTPTVLLEVHRWSNELEVVNHLIYI